MTDYTADNFGTRGSPSKKVQERKLEITSEWGDLVRNQQALAERMIQQEKDVKRLQRDELKNTLQYQMQEKQNARRNEDTNARQLDYNVSIARKADYDNYQSRVKQDNVQLQRNLAVDYSRQQQEREEERRRKIEQEKMVDQRTVTDALDSLQREKMIKDRQREDFKQAVAQQLREKEEMKRMEQERIAREREDQKRLMEENAYKIQAKDSNYRDYYKRVDYQQRNMQQAHDQIVGDKLRAKDRQIDDFINKGVEEARLRAEREEYERQARKQEQLRSMKESVQTKIQEHEDQKRIEKMSYQNKVEDLMRQNVAMQAHQDQMRQYRNNQINDYKATLEYQMKEAEEQKRRQQANMLEHEKKILMNPNDLGLIPGLRSTKADTITSPTFKSSNLINNKPGYPGASNVFVPQQPSAALNTSGSSYGSGYGGQFDSVKSPKLNTSVGNIDYQRHDNHNPITNPMNTNQNPYIRGVDNRAAGFSQRNTFSNAATNNLYGTQ